MDELLNKVKKELREIGEKGVTAANLDVLNRSFVAASVIMRFFLPPSFRPMADDVLPDYFSG